MKRFTLIRLIYLISIFTAILLVSLPLAAQTPTPTPTPIPPADDTQNVSPDKLKGVPEVAPGYRFDDRTQPDLGRVGVDMTEQKPMTLRDTLQLALENNKDIEVTRKNVRIAEYDYQAAHGFYEPRFSGTSYYERAKTPSTSFFGGGPNGSTTQATIRKTCAAT